ncbi:MAG: tetratricopeptide repeat protein, partial [Candidatus Kapabacteria bacterium]|nr:tetratricopeptide repeat protein [Candidatus Kapabacteria bacterium]
FAMIFALHPLLTPAASWISGRNDSLLAMFVAISFVCLTLYYDRKDWSKWLFLALYTLFYAFALFTKEVGVFFPFVVISYVIFFRREKFFTLKTMITAGATMLVGFTWYYLRALAIEDIQNPDTIGFEAFFKNYPTLPAMIGKIFLPIKSIALSSFEEFTIISGILITILLIYAIFKVNNTSKSKILFGISWFLMFLIPTLFIRIVFVDDFFDYAEHRAYLPIIGVFIIVIELLKALKVDFTKKGTLIISMCVIMLFGYKSYTYKRTFDGRKNFWGHMTSIYPDKSRGYLDLGKAYLVKSEFAEAEKLYLRGIVLNPNNVNLYIDLGVLYMQVGRVEDAITKSKQALAIKNTDPMANFNLGWAYNEKGMYAESIPFLENSLRGMNNPNWWMRLGNSYYNTAQHEKAINAFTQVLNMQPNNFIAMSNMAVSLSMTNKFIEAEQMLLKSIQLQPRYPDSYNNLLNIYVSSNQKQKISSVLQAMKGQGINVNEGLAQTLKQIGAM